MNRKSNIVMLLCDVTVRVRLLICDMTWWVITKRGRSVSEFWHSLISANFWFKSLVSRKCRLRQWSVGLAWKNLNLRNSWPDHNYHNGFLRTLPNIWTLPNIRTLPYVWMHPNKLMLTLKWMLHDIWAIHNVSNLLLQIRTIPKFELVYFSEHRLIWTLTKILSLSSVLLYSCYPPYIWRSNILF